MPERSVFNIVMISVLVLAPITWIALTFITAPYGRHVRKGWGPSIPARLGWIIMEAPASLAFATVYFLGERRFEPASLALLALWQLHYFHRAFIYPLRMRAGAKPMPLAIALMGLTFNLANTYVNARWVTHFGTYETSWLADPRFILGALVFVTGFLINLQSDSVLRSLRKDGDAGYKIPQGGMYRFVSSPNYMGEVFEWCGWALACWSLPGVMFAVYTAANLVPRGVSNHKWYRKTFENYPPERRAIVPFLY